MTNHICDNCAIDKLRQEESEKIDHYFLEIPKFSQQFPDIFGYLVWLERQFDSLARAAGREMIVSAICDVACKQGDCDCLNEETS